MSKASEYARLQVEAKVARPMPFMYKDDDGNSRQILAVHEDGHPVFCGGVAHMRDTDALALARWIVETWGEGECYHCGRQTPKFVVTPAIKVEAGLHVSPSGEITGTLPCGHDTSGIHNGTDGGAWPAGPFCYSCRYMPERMLRSPAP